MKIKCIDNNNNRTNLTIGKTYEVIYIYIGFYKITDDYGYKDWHSIKLFKTLSEIRNEKIDKLLE